MATSTKMGIFWYGGRCTRGAYGIHHHTDLEIQAWAIYQHQNPFTIDLTSEFRLHWTSDCFHCPWPIILEISFRGISSWSVRHITLFAWDWIFITGSLKTLMQSTFLVPNLFNIYSLQSTPRSSKLAFSFKISDRNSMIFYLVRATCPADLVADLFIRIIFGEHYTLWAPHYAVLSSLLSLHPYFVKKFSLPPFTQTSSIFVHCCLRGWSKSPVFTAASISIFWHWMYFLCLICETKLLTHAKQQVKLYFSLIFVFLDNRREGKSDTILSEIASAWQ
jgi:hypothetical protein